MLKQNNVSHMTEIHSRQALFTYLKSFNIEKRTDSIEKQAEDMVFVFESLSMPTSSQIIVGSFDHYISDESDTYHKIISNIWLKKDLEENQMIYFDTAKKICSLLGCEDIKELLPDD